MGSPGLSLVLFGVLSICCKNYIGATNVCIPMRDICPFFLFGVEFAACHGWSLAFDTRDLPSVVLYLF